MISISSRTKNMVKIKLQELQGSYKHFIKNQIKNRQLQKIKQ